MGNDKKPKGLTKPYWYFTWRPPIKDIRCYFGKVYGKHVFNFDTPIVCFGYAW